MKSKQFLIETIVSLILVFLALFLLNPFGWWMPDMMTKAIASLLLAVFVIFSGFIWKEKPKDEREVFHRMLAGRFAFLTGTFILIIGIIIQSLQSSIDGWLVVALAGMIIAKFTGFYYGQVKG